jgi:transposase
MISGPCVDKIGMSNQNLSNSQAIYTKSYMIRAACEGHYTVRQVAERLKLSVGRVKQLKATYRKIGDRAFVHGNTGRIPVNKMPNQIKQKIVEMKSSELYIKANFAHFTEILEEEDIAYSYTTIRKTLVAAGHKSPKGRRPRRGAKNHPPRPRREHFGELLQADSSPYDWLGNGAQAALHGFVDDATGSITGLYLCKNECLLGYLEVTRQTIEQYGIPSELYPDKASVFFVNIKEENLTIEEQLQGITSRRTQLGRIMDDLRVNMHPAHSPQAKGRIERLWETLQSRLPIEFKRVGITTIEAANAYLPVYLRKYNAQFAVKPAKNESMFVRLYDISVLDILLAAKIERKTDSSGVFSFHNYKFLVSDLACRGKKINIIMSEKLGFKAMLENCSTLYDIQFCDYHNNKQRKSHMPDVTKSLIERYLTAYAKETTNSDPFGKKAENW